MVPTNSEAAALDTSPAWHDAIDVQVRKIMIARLRNHPALAQHHPILQVREDTGTRPSLLQRLEWMLYHSAGSLSEYLHQPSLERRVQALVTHYKRKRSETDPSDDVLDAIRASAAKRLRPQVVVTEQDIRNCNVGAKGCVLNSNLDLLHHVCSFLGGRDVLRCRAVSKFLYLHAPSFVRSLHIDAATVLNLSSLTISNRVNQTHFKAGVVFPRALTAASYMASLASTSHGYQIVREVAKALKGGACPQLETLELLAPFDFASESDGVLMVLKALAESKVQQRTRTPLKHLVLDATFLGDRGVEQLSSLFESNDAFFEHLQILTVRNNFMGEAGCRALLEATESFSKLKTLDLSRNILTDTDALALADLLDELATDSSYCSDTEVNHKMHDDEYVSEQLSMLGLPALRTLKLQENFITCDGFHAITIALCARHGFVATVGSSRDVNEDNYDDDAEGSEEEEEVEPMDIDGEE
ncbi:hypothetical protein BBJ29_008627 [Phytophthora kernoviae]|uniref:Uncharacterized protein n=1 Tax=Phytophthora kernoviae TaxID=325452 RepID=A0A3F2RK68_9STRA|nr:hypothetical protein BBJ29_008627 [Phytophthora kernoviae]RLN57473.1 hypothetical protein BBP00_00007495 [Phytophthora kernoviae]